MNGNRSGGGNIDWNQERGRNDGNRSKDIAHHPSEPQEHYSVESDKCYEVTLFRLCQSSQPTDRTLVYGGRERSTVALRGSGFVDVAAMGPEIAKCQHDRHGGSRAEGDG